VFAGDSAYKQTKRVFGLLEVDQPTLGAAGEVFRADAGSQCGLSMAKVAKYTYNFTTEAQQAVGIVAQMKAAGVTTLVNAGDPLMFVQLTLAAKQQGWQPEWIGIDPTDTIARAGDQSEMADAVEVGPFGPTPGDSPNEEAGRVYRQASGGAAPASDASPLGSYVLTNYYATLLQLFAGLQGAGPNLTAASWLNGQAAIPDGQGELGTWCFSQLYNPTCSFVVARWHPNQTNPSDRKAGLYVSCDAGRSYPDVGAKMGSGQYAGC